MRIADTIYKSHTADDVYFLLTSYLESLQFTEFPGQTLEGVIALPLGGKDDVKARFHTLWQALDAASRRLDDCACIVIKEAVYVFGTALGRLQTLEQMAAHVPVPELAVASLRR